MALISQLQDEINTWARRNFGLVSGWQPLAGLTEETGELGVAAPDSDARGLTVLLGVLAHAHLKAAQGIRGTPEQHRADQIDAVADILVYLLDYCNREGIDAEEAVLYVWSKVKQRDWKANPATGAAPA